MPTTISGSTGVTFPAGGLANTAGAAVGTTDTQTLTNKTIQGGAITSGTAVASTSGTSIDFTGIPSWVKRITVMFNGVSVNATSRIVAQIGGASIETSGYIGSISYVGATSSVISYTTYFIINPSSTAVELAYGSVLTLSLLDASTNTWSASHSGTFDQSGGYYSLCGGGTKTITGSLAKLRITTAGGTATFDAGSINILYE
jgi:hypothetical protein